MNKKNKKRINRMLWIIFSIITVLAAAVVIFINQPSFGKIPRGERLKRVEKSSHYREGHFKNISETPQLTGDKGLLGSAIDFIFQSKGQVNPPDILPAVNTDLKNLDIHEEILVWFGHSSYLIQTGGKKILVDPVFSGAASPVSFVNKPFKISVDYKPEDMPEIDYLVISHDHWDHLDYNTVKELKDRTGKVICPLGVGEHMQYWGFPQQDIIELDWNEDEALSEGFHIYCLTARHFSGRGLSPNKSVWASFLLQTPTQTIYIGGDSGYDDHFKSIGKRFGKIDLAILENGQYNEDWKFIHMMPEEVVQAAIDLNAQRLLPVHHSKFALARHPWDEPLKRVSKAATEKNVNALTPMIGEKVFLNDSTQIFEEWWRNVR